MGAASTLHQPSFDPISLLENLDLASLRARVEKLDRERKALVILIRSASRRATPTIARKQRKGGKS